MYSCLTVFEMLVQSYLTINIIYISILMMHLSLTVFGTQLKLKKFKFKYKC